MQIINKLLNKYNLENKNIKKAFTKYKNEHLSQYDKNTNEIFEVAFFYFYLKLKMTKEIEREFNNRKIIIYKNAMDEIKKNYKDDERDVNEKLVCNLFSFKNNIDDYR